MKSFDEVVTIMQQRRDDQSPLIAAMIEVRNRYNADYVIPLPTLDDQPEFPPLTPALVANGVDAPAMSAAQITPDIFCPPIDFSKPSGKRSQEYAEKREHAIKATWHANKWNLQSYRLFRHLAGYATSAIVIRPDFKLGIPLIEIRDPLTAYPEPKAAEDVTRIGNAGFIHQRSADWIRRNFPATREEVGGPVAAQGRDEQELWDILEWFDEEQYTWGILGPTYPGSERGQDRFVVSEGRIGRHFHLATTRNRTDMCPVVTGNRITLDRIATQLQHHLGIMDYMARLFTLDMIAAERNVFPDLYIIGDRGGSPRVVSNSGNWADGRTGQINVIEDANAVGQIRSTPDPMTRAAYDTLERNFKVSTGQFGAQMGENTSNLRTGRALSEMYGMSVDPMVMELQRIAEHALAEMNGDILRCWETYWPERKVRLFAGFSGNRAIDEFEPERHVEEMHENSVSYTIAGADVQQTTIALGQLYGTDAISLETFRRRHPYIEDAEFERRAVESERMERTMFDSILQRASTGELPVRYLAVIARHLKDGVGIADAIEKADQELAEAQATPPPAPEAPMALPPEAMPGLEAAGAGGGALAALGAGPTPQPEPTIGPTPNQVGLDQLMSAMRGGGLGGA